MARIFVNVIALLKRGEERTVWNGSTDAEAVMLVVSSEEEVAESD